MRSPAVPSTLKASNAQFKGEEFPDGRDRVIIEAVSPEIDAGDTPVKRLVGESLTVTADIFCDGHDILGAQLLYRAQGRRPWRSAPMRFDENDRWSARMTLDSIGRYEFTIEAWRDIYASWRDEIDKKLAAGQDVRSETLEGVRLAETTAKRAAAIKSNNGAAEDAALLRELVQKLASLEKGSEAQRRLLIDGRYSVILAQYGERANLSRYRRTLRVIADRRAALFSSWYELFPRSQTTDPHRHGSFQDVIAHLSHVREMGFDVLYLPPIHPIGRKNRKGRNNVLQVGPGDPGSVYAIGAVEGGHDAIHPALGSFDDFDRLVQAAQALGIEIALDFAVQCSLDHPWLKEHPEWFQWRPDGSIKTAENPPKKYEDIVNVEFYGASLPGLWIALRDVVLFWISRGIKIFRVDNPHTKPLPFWRWLLDEISIEHPDVIFLAEAFTRPKMMKKLAKIGFQQSYTYFTWRNTKSELTAYMTELTGEMSAYYRPNFFANTPDINPYYLQSSGPPGFIIRATLAATLSSAYGIYSGFEFCEAAALPGREEYLDSEKYEIKARAVPDVLPAYDIRPHIKALNTIRRDNPALWDFRNVLFLNAWNDNIIAYMRMTPSRDNFIFVMINLDPHKRQECDYEIPLWEFGLSDEKSLAVTDLLLGNRFLLNGKIQHIVLDPLDRSVMIWKLERP